MRRWRSDTSRLPTRPCADPSAKSLRAKGSTRRRTSSPRLAEPDPSTRAPSPDPSACPRCLFTGFAASCPRTAWDWRMWSPRRSGRLRARTRRAEELTYPPRTREPPRTNSPNVASRHSSRRVSIGMRSASARYSSTSGTRARTRRSWSPSRRMAISRGRLARDSSGSTASSSSAGTFS